MLVSPQANRKRLHPVPGAKENRGNPEPRGIGRVNNAVLVLNQNYEPLNICNVRRAIVLVIGGKMAAVAQRVQALRALLDVLCASGFAQGDDDGEH